MAELNNNFIGGKMNKDLDERLLNPSEYRDALNITVGSSESDNVGSGQNVLGNTLISDLTGVIGSPSVNAKTIGAVKVEALNLIYWLVTSDNYDAILEYDEIHGTTTRVLQCNKPGSALNFNENYLVTGINFVNGFLYWTDNYNPPRKINISRAKSYPINSSKIAEDINVILAPPLNSPKIVLGNDGSQSDNLEDKFIYFSYRYKYLDNQYSAFSPFSSVSFFPDNFNLDYEKGNNASMTNKYNYADIFFNTGNENVKEIQLLFRDAKSTTVYAIESFDKEKNGYDDFEDISFRFKNNKTYLPLTADQVTRLFDNVPLKAKAQDFVGNRIMYGNYTQFYNIEDSNGDEIKIDFNLGLSESSTTEGTPIRTFRSDRDYEVGMIYLDDYGRCSTVLTCPENSIYISPDKSVKGNSIDVTIKHTAPEWATHYRFAIKQSKDEYYNIFPLTFYSDGLFRYFKINKSDIDKIKVGDYLILKSDASNPTYSNKKYKVLELDQKEANFLGKGELEGLYFKIKVDSIIEIDGSDIQKINDIGEGAGVETNGASWQQNQPLFNTTAIAYNEDVIHYGSGYSNAITIVQYLNGLGLSHCRYTITSDAPNTYKVYRKELYTDSSTLGVLVGSGNIVANTNTTVENIVFKFNQNTLTVGDRYVVNVRNPLSRAYYLSDKNNDNVAVINLDNSLSDVAIKKGAIITMKVTTDDTNNNLDSSLQTFLPSPSNYKNIEEWWFESGAYQQFKFFTTGGTDIGGRSVWFYRGYKGNATGQNASNSNDFLTTSSNVNTLKTLPLNMLINSSATNNKTTNTQPHLLVNFTLTQSDKSTIFETEGKDNDADIFHELSDTYPIDSNGNHVVRWSYEDFTSASGGYTNLGQAVPGTKATKNSIPHRFVVGDIVHVKEGNYVPTGTYNVIAVPDAYNIVIDLAFPGSGPVTPGSVSWSSSHRDQNGNIPALTRINNITTFNTDFNCWSFGNGLESNRIYDDWNEITNKYSPRVTSTVEDYRQLESISAICYSGIYGMNTSVDKLNEFNLSLANFKYLDINYGSIQRLDSRDSDLLVFQQDKVSKVLYGKNLLFDAVGGSSVASIPEVLGTQVPYYGEYGISNNPESFVKWGSERYFTDARRGAVLRLNGDSLEVISSYGMTDFFRDSFRDKPNNKRLGSYDPHNKLYVLAANDDTIYPCKLEINRTETSISKNSQSVRLFNIISNTEWTITAVDFGDGTDWVSTQNYSGSGNATIETNVSQNNTGDKRIIKYLITYCNEENIIFTLTQGSTSKTELVNIVYKNNTKLGAISNDLV